MCGKSIVLHIYIYVANEHALGDVCGCRSPFKTVKVFKIQIFLKNVQHKIIIFIQELHSEH